MKKQIREVLSKYRGNQGYTMEHAESELLNLFSVALSLLGVAKCPNVNCDNNGTIATQEYPSGEWIPEPCEWCHRKKELLNNEG
jgi:hypothetical protein